jgi:hypothetical protein
MNTSNPSKKRTRKELDQDSSNERELLINWILSLDEKRFQELNAVLRAEEIEIPIGLEKETNFVDQTNSLVSDLEEELKKFLNSWLIMLDSNELVSEKVLPTISLLETDELSTEFRIGESQQVLLQGNESHINQIKATDTNSNPKYTTPKKIPILT